VVAAAFVVAVLGRLTAGQLRLLGSVVTTTGVLGLVILLGWDLTRWLRSMPPGLGRYAGQRILFALGTNTDLPLVQATAAGAVCWIVGTRRKNRKARDPSDHLQAPSPRGMTPCPTTPSSPTT
jgi:hypothetical protein